MLAELGRIGQREVGATHEDDAESRREFAMALPSQFYYVCVCIFQQYYRQPEYIMAKFVLGIVPGLFIGFSFGSLIAPSEGSFQLVPDVYHFINACQSVREWTMLSLLFSASWILYTTFPGNATLITSPFYGE